MSITYTPGPIPRARPGALVLCYLMNGPGDYALMPNVVCLSVAYREGGDPGTARFRYILGSPYASPAEPSRFEQCWPLDAYGPYVVPQDARIVVVAWHGDGSHTLLFDGYAQSPQADLAGARDGGTEEVSFIALGTCVREFDFPLQGAMLRDADNPLVVQDTQTDLPARFNPDGRPNATPDSGDNDTYGAAAAFPTFLGPVTGDQINGETLRTWTLGMAARYVIAVGSLRPDGFGNMEPSLYVNYGDLSLLDSYLTAWQAPGGDQGALDDEGSDFVVEDIECPDVDVTGMCWPEALRALVEPFGFGVTFVLSEGAVAGPQGFGDPQWTLNLFWKESDTPGKVVALQTAGSTLDPGQSNIGALALVRDASSIANAIAIDAAPIRVECSFVLAPGFQPLAADIANRANFVASAQAQGSGAVPDKYRLFIFDECSEGTYKYAGGGSWTATNAGGDLTPAFQPIAQAQGLQGRPWAIRRRKPLAECLSLDDDGEPAKATLFVSLSNVPMPGVLTNTKASWQVVTGGWELLPDRIGVRLTMQDPNSWVAYKTTANTPAIFPPKLNLIELFNASPAAYPTFMLTTCIDMDDDMNVTAPPRSASTTAFKIWRRRDARDRFRKRIVSRWSWYAAAADYGTAEAVAEDDTAAAQALADGARRHSEAAAVTGSVVVPRLTTAYALGDKVTAIAGRAVDLRSNLGAGSGESPIYPCVVALSWSLDGEHATTLELSDARPAPPPRRQNRNDSD